MGFAQKNCTRLGFEPLEPRLALSGSGLTAQYFHNVDFTGLADTRVEAVIHNWGTGDPGAGIDADTFSVRWTGQIEPEFSQLYTFRALSDEGVRVWVDGQLLINDWTPHVRRLQTGTIALAAGQRYDIRVDYFEGTGAAQMELTWTSASQPIQAIPASRLYESPAGLFAWYRDTTGGSLSRVDGAIDFDWGLGSPPHTSLDSDGVQVTWTGQIRADFSELYSFSTISDDGVRLWIGGELVIDNWTSPVTSQVQGTKRLEAGKWTDVRLEYYENTASAHIEWRWSSARQTGTGLFEVVPQANLRAMKDTRVVFENPLGTGADPFVIEWQDKYYMSRSDGGAVWINRADSLEDIHDSSLGSDTILAWRPPVGTNYSGQVWAPELHRLGDNWYIYVAASNGMNETHRMHVLERVGSDPFGAFTYKGQIAVGTDRWAIDGTVLEWQNSLYFVWSGWPGFTNGVQNIYIAEMRNPWTLRTDRVQISTPQFAWEQHGLPINEGPQILIHDGKLHIIYSASGYWTPQYALGRLTYNGTGSLLSAASWTKATQPVFKASSEVVGVGHASFVKSPDGTEDWIVYHAHKNPLPTSGEIRDVRIQPFTFFANGTPNFGAPLPSNEPILVPSVGSEPQRVFVAGDYNGDGLVNSHDYTYWRATFGKTVFPASAADGNENGVVDLADYVLWRRNLVSTAAVSPAAPPPQQSQKPLESTSIDAISISPQTMSVHRRETARRSVLVPPVVDVALQDWLDDVTLLASRRPIEYGPPPRTAHGRIDPRDQATGGEVPLGRTIDAELQDLSLLVN